MTIDVALNPAEIALLPQRDLSATTCVVFDVLRATSSMITALAHGVSEIHPVRTIEDALALRSRIPGALLGGERNGERPEGFDFGNSPLEYRELGGAKIVWTTTNGTMALTACARAKRVLIGALLNLDAVIAAVRDSEHVLLVCAGTFETAALEDVFAAGLAAGQLAGAKLTDAAEIALATAQHFTAKGVLTMSRNALSLLAKGRDAELQWCERRSVYNVVGLMDGSIIRPI